MSFTTFKNKPISKKIILAEFDIPIEGDVLINYEAGIWHMTLTPGVVTIEGESGEIGYYENQNEIDYLDISSLKVDDDDFVKVYNFANLRTQEGSFYYEKLTTKLYIHFYDFDYPLNKIIIPGVVYGFCDKVDRIKGAYYNDTYYEPRIESVPSINKSKDPLFFGLMRFEGGNVVLNNKDGYFDKFKDANMYRQAARIKFGFEGLDYDEYRTVYTGYIEKYNWNFKKFTVALQDIRKGLSRSLPVNFITKTDYPNLSDSNNHAPKPLIYGKVYNVPLMCLNEEDGSATNYEFLIMDTEYHNVTQVHNVYIDGELLDPANYSVNAATGILTIASTYVSDALSSVTADVTGANIKNALAVVRDILHKYDARAFITPNFNTAEWNLAEADARNIGIFINEDKEIQEIIEDCCKASDVQVIVQDDGKYTARMYYEDRTPVQTIHADEWLGEPQVQTDETKFLSSCVVKYAKNYDDDSYLQYRNTAYEQEVLKRYKSYQGKTFETILADEAGAIAKSEVVMQLSKKITDIVKRKVKTQHIDLEIMDMIIASPATRPEGEETKGVWEVIGINKILSRGELELSTRFVKNYIPFPLPEYSTGYIYNHYMIGHHMHAVAYL